jgi:zinc transport system substrate-binding protein
MRYIIPFLAATSPALAEVPTVVTDIPPVHALVGQVLGDLGRAELLLAKGADEHDFQLRPSQARAVAGADLVVWIGPDLTPWLEGALETRPEAAATLGLLGAKETVRRLFGDGAPDAHDEAATGPDAQDNGYDQAQSRGQGSEDPHAWLDPGNAQVWLGLIAAELARLDPANAATYAANAAAAAEELVRLDAELATVLAPVGDKPIVTFHDAFGYFAGHYGLTIAGSIAEGDAATPGAARLAELQILIVEGKVACVFPEVQQDPALAEQLVEGTSVRIGGALDPVGSSLEPGPGAYAALLTGIARTIADCAGG